eukprot:CAMPEP_0194544110 /NCGR_PEP_ID=MMETSP0253-20130528/86944_1 /TAXON_ID=2966 /ORGANISM="Noctiluca scintillans" /LENGTH=120 /DNA_ID=CAMNT_0039390949 /DNA_START=302 /DNA_END=664 /DNA_ORIENTATION=-
MTASTATFSRTSSIKAAWISFANSSYCSKPGAASDGRKNPSSRGGVPGAGACKTFLREASTKFATSPMMGSGSLPLALGPKLFTKAAAVETLSNVAVSLKIISPAWKSRLANRPRPVGED